MFDIYKKGETKSDIKSMSANYGITDKIDLFIRYDQNDPNNLFTYDKNGYTDDDEDDLSRKYFVTGVVLNCGSGLSVAPNMRKTTYQGDAKKSETEYKVNFQFTF